MTWTLVTGGAKRLGAELCRTLAEQGNPILVHYKSNHRDAAKVVKKCRTYGVEADSIQGDFSTPQSTSKFIKTLLKQYPSIKNLINNASCYLTKSGLHTTAEEWETLFQINLHAPTALIQALLPSIKKSHGAILNLGVSGLNALRADTYSTAYRMSKSALLMLTRSLARELAPFQVAVNMISPGQLDISIDKPDDLSTIPMGRLGTPHEVAQVAAFLLKHASYITGQNIEVAGGLGL